jgi:DNA-binding beta-propeller fold protein YncE
MKPHWIVGLLLAAAVVAGAGAGQQPQNEYKFLKRIPIGGEGGWDYLSIDATAGKLYVSHATKIVVVDLARDAVSGEISNTPGVHGIAVAPTLGRGFTSNGAEGQVSVVDLKTLQTVSKVETGRNPDAILYEPGRREIYAFNGGSRSATVINAETAKAVATIPLPGKPEFAVADPKSGRVFCNIEDKSEVAAIDTGNHTVTATWPLAPGEEPTGLAIDAAHHRLFAGCHNKLMVMLDSDTGKTVATVPIGAGVDACAFDDGTGFAFASCGDGTITIAKEETPQKLKVVQTLRTERGARTMALNPSTHRIYTATAKIKPGELAAARAEHRWPTYVSGTFHLLVYGTK